MLNILREKSKIFLWIVAVAFIGFMVAVWGMDLRQSETVASASTIGEVNGRKITVMEYQNAIRSLMDTYRKQNSDQEPPDDARRDMADQAWQTLIERSVLGEEVRRRKITVSDPEIVSYIRSNPVDMFVTNPAFQTNGQFDVEKYRQALNDPRIDWTWLEEYVRGLLPFEKLRQEVAATVSVTEDEIREKFLAEQERIRVSYLAVPLRDFRDTTVAVTDAEIESYFKEHSEELQQPDQAVVAFVLFETKPSAADEEDARSRAVEIVEEARGGGDFAEMARIYSEDVGTATNGGDLGFFGRGAMVPEFDQAAFSLEPGTISDPVKSSFGYHVLKVEEKRRSEAGAEEVHARHILLKIEPSPETMTSLRERANALTARAREDGFDKAAQSEGLTPTQTPAFGKGDFLPGIGMFRRANSFVFSNDKGAVSPVLEGPRGNYVFTVLERRAARLPEIAEVRDAVREQVRLARARVAARARAEELLAALRSGQTLEDTGSRFGIEKRETPLVNRITTLSGIGRETPFTHAAFALQPGQLSGVVELNSGFYILRVEERQPANESQYALRKEDLRRALYGEKLNTRFGEFVQGLIAKADIKDRRGAQDEG